jgi:hypothetical protein
MFDLKVVLHSIQSSRNKDDNAYKITEYYEHLTNSTLDDGGIALVM